MAPKKGTPVAVVVTEVTDEDLLPESRPEELPPETGTAVPKPIPVRYTIVGKDEGGTLSVRLHGGFEAEVPYWPGDLLVHVGDAVTPLDAAAFNRQYRVVQGEDTESAYDERFPKFSTGGTAYVRVPCPSCDATMLFSVEVGEVLTMGDKSQLKPTFKVKPKEHFCGQTSAKLEDLEDAPDDEAVVGASDADDEDDDAAE